MGAEGLQIGTRFAITVESSAHQNYKKRVVEASDNDTILAFKKIGLVRMLKNDFALKAVKANEDGWNEDKLKTMLGNKREMLGIFEGNENEGEMEAGQGSGLIKEILPVDLLMNKLLVEVEKANVRNQKMVTARSY